jgi:ketosteroid isomerase-like protein
MSLEEEVAAIRGLWGAFSKHADPTALDFLDPDVELEDHLGLVGGETHHGHAGAIEWAASMWKSFDSIHVEPMEFLELDDGRVLATYQVSGISRRSGARVRAVGYALFTMRGGKVLHVATDTTRLEDRRVVELRKETALEGNMAVVRRSLDCLVRRDIPAWLACFDPAVEVSEDVSIPDAGSYHGHAGLMRWLHVMERNWEEFEVSGERFLEHGDDVVTLYRVRGTGKASGIPIEGRFASLLTFRSGRVVSGKIYAGWKPAFEATGLRG